MHNTGFDQKNKFLKIWQFKLFSSINLKMQRVKKCRIFYIKKDTKNQKKIKENYKNGKKIQVVKGSGQISAHCGAHLVKTRFVTKPRLLTKCMFSRIKCLIPGCMQIYVNN